MPDYMAMARFTSQLSYEHLSDETKKAIKRILLDSIGCMVGGSKTMNFTMEERELNRGRSTIVGVGSGYSREWAVVMNGCTMVSTEMDEGNQFAKGHPAAHFLPALLAEAEERKSSGKELITAFAAAYEIAVRYGSAVTLRSSIHPHGNCGTGSSAVAIAKLRRMSENEIYHTMLLGSSMPVTSVWTSAFTGATVRNGYIGVSNVIGLLAVSMTQVGIRSNSDVLDTLYGDVLGTSYSLEIEDEGIGSDFKVEKNYMKVYACCRFVHGAIDCVLTIKEQMSEEGQELNPDQIKSVKVETYKAAAALKEVKPPNSLAAKFSIPFSLAILLGSGRASQDVFTDENVKNEAWIELASKICVEENEEFSRLLPDVRATRVTMEMADGNCFTKELHTATGDYNQPLTNEQIVHKFLELAAPVLGEETCLAIVDLVFSIEEAEDVSELMKLLFPLGKQEV